MIGTIANFIAILVGTIIGCAAKDGLGKRYEEALFTALGLAALGIGL